MRVTKSRRSVAVVLIFGLAGLLTETAAGQKSEQVINQDDLIFHKGQFIQREFKPENITKIPGRYAITDWQNAIDSTWGWGLLKSQKISILNTFWNKIDDEFACFVNHPDYYAGWWDSLYTLYYDEVNNGDPTYGVSQGRFAAIMFYLSMSLKEIHTYALDNMVTLYTALDPGVPLIICGGHGENGHFGAGLTPLPDSTLLVYKAVSPHPLGLVPGDIVLGYDGVPWKDLYRSLHGAQLPIAAGWNWASAESAFNHLWLMSAGMNWHLFDTLDVVKYSTGDTLHLSVQPLIGQSMSIWCSEQLDVPGVALPDYSMGQRASYGIITGTQIGYIYVMEWDGNVESELYDAVNTLMNDYETTGLIIDLRIHYGGWPAYANKSLKLLFNTKEPLYGWDERCSPNDHLALCPKDFYAFHYIYGSAKSYYDKPIAVLAGPGAVSGGDHSSLSLKFHPMTRIFGKPTNGGFNYGSNFSLGNSNWTGRQTPANMYLLDDPGNHLTRWELEVDETVWLEPDDVAQGYDTVVEAAKSWINSQQGTQPELGVDSTSIDMTLDYGEIASETLTLSNNGNRTLFYSLTPDIDSGAIDISKSASVTMGHGGYDNYGYTWIDSDQPHGPSFNWIDISAIGTPVSLGDDNYAGPIDIGFDFTFYGNDFSELYICSNGLLTFGAGTGAYANTQIPSPGYPNNFISPWWDDLSPNIGGNVKYYSSPDSGYFIVSFINVPKYSYGGASTFQVILHSNGHIEINYLGTYLYRNSFDMYTATIGIENSDGSDGLEIYYNAPYTIDSLSILITTDWLAVSPYSSYIAPGENEQASITFSAKHLGLGTYTGNIFLDSNDPVDSLIVIPVSLTVTGGCDFIVGDVNGPGSYNGLDITYGVNFFKYGNPPPQCPDCPLDDCNSWHYCGDVNGSCNYNGLDITYGVNYFKLGSPAPVPCPDCPPVE